MAAIAERRSGPVLRLISAVPWAYLVRRLLSTIPVMAIVALFVFSLLYIAPGDPAAICSGAASGAGTS